MFRDDDLNRIKIALPKYLASLGCEPNRGGRCRCPVHMGEHKTTAFLDTQAGLVTGMPTLLHCPKCDNTWDIVSLYAELNGLDDQRDFVRIVDALSNELGIRIDKSQIREPAQSPNQRNHQNQRKKRIIADISKSARLISTGRRITSKRVESA